MAAKKQGELAGFERPKIQALEDLAEVYEKDRDKRVKQSKAEVASKRALIDGMRKHKQDTYRLDSGEIITLGTKYDVKITEAEDKSDDSEGEKGEEAN